MAGDNIWTSRAQRVASARSDSRFTDLVMRSGLDPRSDFRFADWSGCSFVDCDLAGFDFTGARLLGCDFTDSRIVGARFDLVEIDHAVQGATALRFERFVLSRNKAEKRIALIIGNGRYSHAHLLANPVNDAEAMAATLTRLGFEIVKGIDLDLRAMSEVLSTFEQQLRSHPNVALLFYAGYGLEVEGQKYLVPVDAEINTRVQLGTRALRLNEVLDPMSKHANTSIVFWDACRDNPYKKDRASEIDPANSPAQEAERQIASAISKIESGASSFARNMHFDQTFIAYATSPGRVSFDGSGANSPFTGALLRHIETPGLSISDMMIDVRNSVLQETKGRQEPWDESSLRSRFNFVPMATRKAHTNLRAAKDWANYVKLWRPSPNPVTDGSHLPVGAIFQDAPFGPDLVVVPPGRFTIGTSPEEMAVLEKEHGSEYGQWVKREGPQREVKIGHRLAVGRFAVTFEEWDAAQSHPDWRRLSGPAKRILNDYEFGRGRRPVIDVSWDDANAYAHWLSEVTGQAYRLLTEAEWEYCCRAGTTTHYAVGDTISKEQAQFGAKRTVEVGSFACNAWGFHDMHGNVWEWCQDAWDDSYDELPDDGSARDSKNKDVSRVVRGGSWSNRRQLLRSAFRTRYQPTNRYHYLGFRLARTLSP